MIMFSGRRLLVGTVAGMLSFAASPEPADGQAPPSKPAVPIATIEVVATRTPEAPHDVPLSIEVISGADLRARGATSLKDALALAAGVAIAPGGDNGPASAVPEFWGLREFDAFLLVVDGIPWGGAFNPAVATLSRRHVICRCRPRRPQRSGRAREVSLRDRRQLRVRKSRGGCPGAVRWRVEASIERRLRQAGLRR